MVPWYLRFVALVLGLKQIGQFGCAMSNDLLIVQFCQNGELEGFRKLEMLLNS